MFEYLQPADKPVVKILEDKEVIYAKNQPEYNPLRVLRSEDKFCNVLSRWTFTNEQRKSIAEGADVYLELMTFGSPLQPIRLMIIDEADIHNAADFLKYNYNLVNDKDKKEVDKVVELQKSEVKEDGI